MHSGYKPKIRSSALLVAISVIPAVAHAALAVKVVESGPQLESENSEILVAVGMLVSYSTATSLGDFLVVFVGCCFSQFNRLRKRKKKDSVKSPHQQCLKRGASHGYIP